MKQELEVIKYDDGSYQIGIKGTSIVVAEINDIENADVFAKQFAASSELLEACKKSLNVFNQLADAGQYPFPLEVENGGEGWQYLEEVIKKATE